MEVGFEPTEGLPPHTLSRSAAARSPWVSTVRVLASGSYVMLREHCRTLANETRTETEFRNCCFQQVQGGQACATLLLTRQLAEPRAPPRRVTAPRTVQAALQQATNSSGRYSTHSINTIDSIQLV